jgi:hypothetical protein
LDFCFWRHKQLLNVFLKGKPSAFDDGKLKGNEMGNNTKPQLMIDGIEYDVEKLNEQQRAILDHVVDLERKVASARFNLDQLTVGRDTFFNMLKESLKAQPVEAIEKIEEVVES